MTSRGQTTQDYLIGVTLVLLTLVSVFALVPTLFGVTQDVVDSAERAAASELGDYLVNRYSVPGANNTLVFDELDDALSGSTGRTISEIAIQEAGMRPRENVNVTIVTGGEQLRSYPSHDVPDADRTTATSIRVVRFTNPRKCVTVCRIIVRVW